MDCPRENLPTIRGLLTEALKNRREYKWSGELSRDLDGFVDTIFKEGLSKSVSDSAVRPLVS